MPATIRKKTNGSRNEKYSVWLTIHFMAHSQSYDVTIQHNLAAVASGRESERTRAAQKNEE